MSIRKTNFVNGEYYHIYNRGNSKQKIFLDKEDYFYFIKLLFFSNRKNNFKFRDIKEAFSFEYNGSKLVSIGAWCLMPNHFHILITQIDENEGISKFMQKLSTAYSMYYNKKYKRTGSLFEGKFKSKYVSSDIHMKYLYSYIHLNPIKIIQADWKEKGIRNQDEAIRYLDQYQYSSYLDYSKVEKRSFDNILDRKSFPEYFRNQKGFQTEIFDWLSLADSII